LLRLAIAAALLAPAGVAQAQFSDSYKFLDAVRKADGETVTRFVDQPGVTLINTRDRSTGETALHIVVTRRDLTWTNFLLAKGAAPDAADNRGATPLMIAVEKRWPEGVELLLARKADVNKANGSGETPLIRAVQYQDLGLVRLLMANGANPDKRDSIAGMSARDYARRDGRVPGLVEALDKGTAPAAKKPVQGPQL
jgi:ankyrin repeat protein